MLNENAEQGQVLRFTFNAGNDGGVYYAPPTGALTSGQTYTWVINIRGNREHNMYYGHEQNGLYYTKINWTWCF